MLTDTFAHSDPVRHVLAHLLYYLMREPRHLDAVLQELASVNIRHYKSLQYLQHFNACIYETLRLEPAVPSAGLRMPPKGGMSINGVFVPEDTTIVTPQYSTQRGQL
jgi:tryprostatin B 6-hydroxylase